MDDHEGPCPDPPGPAHQAARRHPPAPGGPTGDDRTQRRSRPRFAAVGAALGAVLVIVAVNGLIRLVLAVVEVDFPDIALPGWVGETFDAVRPVRFALVAVLLLAAACGEYARHRRAPQRRPDARPPQVPSAPDADDQADGTAPR